MGPRVVLGQKLAELEAQSGTASSDLELKLKQADDKHKDKIKESKSKDTAFQKSEKAVRDLNDKLSAANKKILDLETYNTRLKVVTEDKVLLSGKNNKAEDASYKEKREEKSHHSPKASSSKSRSRHNSSPRSSSSKSPGRCIKDNTGKCAKGKDCREQHVRRTCQLYSKLAFCPPKPRANLDIL